MGMYDNIICKYPLPGGFRAPDFQTKSFDDPTCSATHLIDEEGVLWLDKGHYIDTPEEKRPKERIPIPAGASEEQAKTLKAFNSLCGILTWVPDLIKQTDFDGEVNFYTHDEKKEWYEYNAEFAHGKLIKITKVEPEIAPQPAANHPKPTA